MDEKSKVYIKTDLESSIIRCEGGYTMGNIDNVDEWIFIDEGVGDRYNLCQSHYFPTPLYEEHGVPVYKLENGVAVERTKAEIEEDIAALPEPGPTQEQRIADLEADSATMAEALIIAFGG